MDINTKEIFTLEVIDETLEVIDETLEVIDE